MTKRRWGSVTRHRDGWRVRAPNVPGYGRESLGVFATRAEAEAIRKAGEEAAHGTTPGMTLAAWGEKWLLERRTRWPRQERCVWKTHIASSWIADRLVRRIDRRDVVRWIREVAAKRATVNGVQVDRFLSRQTVQHVLNLLRLCLGAAADEGVAPSNPAIGVRVPRGAEALPDAHEVRDGAMGTWAWLTSDEIDRLLSSDAPERSRIIWTVAIYTGLRPGELWGLRWCDVRLDDAPEIYVRRSYRTGPKTPFAVRHVPLLSAALNALKRWQKIAPGVGEALVFPNGAGRCHDVGYDADLLFWRKRLGITRPKISMRSLRHTCASHLVKGTWTEKKLSLFEVRAVLGHSSITVTQRYAHLGADSVREAMKDASSGHKLDTRPKKSRKERGR